MITGASEADVAVLVVSVKPGETEAAIYQGPSKGTRLPFKDTWG